jgi:hypothetical protein
MRGRAARRVALSSAEIYSSTPKNCEKQRGCDERLAARPLIRRPSADIFSRKGRRARATFDYVRENLSSTLRVICWVKTSLSFSPMIHSQLPAVTTSPLPRVMWTIMPEP